MKLFLPILFLCLVVNASCAQQKGSKITTDHIKNAEQLYGLEFTETERELMLEDVRETTARGCTRNYCQLQSHASSFHSQ